MRYEFPKAHRGEFGPVRKACELMKVSKSGYYEYIHRRKSNAQIEREALEGFVKDVFECHHARYGYRRINQELRKMNIFVSEKCVLHIMRRWPCRQRCYEKAQKAKGSGTGRSKAEYRRAGVFGRGEE